MNSYRRGLQNGVLVNPKLFILGKVNLAPPTIGWLNLVKLVKNLYYLVRVVTLWAYRTTHKSATRETPFALAFGTEAVASVEVGLKSPRIELAAEEHNDEALRLNLDLLDERRDQVLRRTEDYQRKTARYYNQKVKPRSYKLGDLVLKKLMPARKNPAHGKLGPNWEGPYIISRVVRPGNYELQT